MGDDDWKDDDWHHDDHKDDDWKDRRSLFEHHDKEIVTTARAISGSSSYSSGHEAYTTAGTVTDVSGHAGAAVAGAGAVAGGYDWKGSAFASSGALSESVVGDGIVGVLAESVDVTETEGHGEASAISAALATGKAIIHKKKHDKPDDNPSHDDGDDDWKDDDWHHDDHKDDDWKDRRSLFEHHDAEIVTTAAAVSG